MKRLGAQLTLAMALAALPLGALAEYWQYETEDGTVAFTDDPKRIPTRYRAGAEKQVDRAVWDYERATISKRGAARETLQTELDPERIAELVPAYAPTPALGPVPETWIPGGPIPTPPAPTRVRVDLGGGSSIEADAQSDAPIRVERQHYRTNSRGITAPHTVVTQGGRTIAIIEERP